MLAAADWGDYFRDSQDHEERLEAAKLLWLLQYGSDLKVVGRNSHNVEVRTTTLLANLCLFLHLYLSKYNSYYTNELAKPKKEYENPIIFMNVPIIDERIKFTEPFTKEELKNIIQYETSKVNQLGSMRGKNSNNPAPMLGKFATEGLEAAPIIKNQTTLYNLIGDLMDYSGVLLSYKGQEWKDYYWADMDRAERKNEVRGWLASYKLALDKQGGEPIYLADYYKTTIFRADFDYKPMSDEQVFLKDFNKLDW